MENIKKSIKNRIVLLCAILFMADILISVKDNIRFGVTIVKYSYAVVLPYLIILFGRLSKFNSEDRNKKIIKNGIILYCIVQFACFVFSLLISERFRNEYFGAVHFLNWIFLAIPVYLLIVEKFEKNIKVLPLSIILAVILTYDNSIANELFRNIICFFPFFIIGWNYEKIVEKFNNKQYFIILVGIVLTLLYSYLNVRQYSVSENLYEQYVIVFLREKFILYTIPILLFLFSEKFIAQIGFLNKEYNLNIISTIFGLTILTQIIGQYDYHNIATGRRFIILVAIFSLLVTTIISFLPIEKLKPKHLKSVEDNQNENDNLFIKFINSNFMIIIIVIVLMLKTTMFYYNTVYAGIKIPMIILGYNLGYILVLIIPIFLTKNNKARYIEILIYDIFISTLLFMNEIYFSYSKIVISINQIYNIKYVNEITSVAVNLLKFRQILYFADIVFLIILPIVIKFKSFKTLNKKQYLRSVIAGFIVLYIFTNDIINLNNRIAETNFSNDFQIQACTIYGFYITDVQNFINNKKNLKYKSKDEINDAYTKLKEEYSEYGEKYRGIAKGKNVIIVQLEALQEFLYGLEINGEEVTPNLNKFLDENIHLKNMHAQSYTTTADSEFSVVSSLYPLDNGLSFAKYFNVDYDDIFTALQKNGYYTAFFHGNNGQFWNRGRVYKEFGLDEANFKESFNEKESVMWYLSDRVLYKEAVEKMENYQQPFMSNIVSASSHTPFTLLNLDKSVLTIDVGEEYKDTFFGNYLESANYADIQFGNLINMLKENGMYDNSIIIAFGDHYGMPMGQEEMLRFFKENGKELNSVEDKLNFTNVLAGIHIPGVDSQIIEKPVSKIDVKPTVLSLIDEDDEFSLGTSFFSNKDFVCTNVGTIITENKYFDSVNWYDIKSGEIIDLNSLDDDERKLLEKYERCMMYELDISRAYPVIMK